MSTFDSEPLLVPAPILSTPEPPLTNAFVGPLGPRAGWGILIFLVLGLLLAFGVGYLVVTASGQRAAMHRQQVAARAAASEARRTHALAAPQPMLLSLQFVAESGQTAGFLLAAVALSYLERRRFRVYGLEPRHGRDLLPGALWGLIAMGVLVGALRGLGLVVFDRRLLFGGAIAVHGAGWLLLFLLVGLSEEFLFRGYLQFTLMRGLLGLARRVAPAHQRLAAFWMSAVFWSAIFLAAHISNSGENPLGLIGVFLAGILFAYALWRTGSLWWGIGFHMTWDWSQSFLYGVPDSGTLSVGRLFQTHPVGNPLLSGGVDGPEASLLLIPVLLLMFAVLRLHPLAAQPPVEQEAPAAGMHTPLPGTIA